MYAGRPMLVVPFSHDQPDNAQRVERMGIGKRIPRAKFSVRLGEAALSELLEDRSYTMNAIELATRLRKEDGIAAACDCLEAVLR
jgi:rhamnosyltransferase subunit B